MHTHITHTLWFSKYSVKSIGSRQNNFFQESHANRRESRVQPPERRRTTHRHHTAPDDIMPSLSFSTRTLATHLTDQNFTHDHTKTKTQDCMKPFVTHTIYLNSTALEVWRREACCCPPCRFSLALCPPMQSAKQIERCKTN